MRFFLFLLLFFASNAYGLGSEIKVLDSQGISRAIKRNVSKAVVELVVHAPDGSAVSLENVDGLASNADGIVKGDGRVSIPVTEGTWRINSAGHKVLEVKIVAPR